MRLETNIRYLPLYARIAIELLDSDSDKRNVRTLNYLINAYARTYNEEPPEYVLPSAIAICSKRFGDTFDATLA